jgi:hypothetical protein
MTDTLPHTHVYARLAPSPIDGVGVFAIRMIPAGADIFPDDRLGVHWFDRAEIDRAATDPAMRRYYNDFCIRQGDRYGCPVNFNSMTIGWYLNEPPPGEDGNVTVDEHYAFRARRDILPGEELTVRYADFSTPDQMES